MNILLLLLASACFAADPKAAQMHYLQGQLLERKGSYPEALAAYEAALAEDPASGYISREAADLALEMGEPEKALRLARQAVTLEPREAVSHALLGRVQWALGEADEARKAFEAALRLDPKSAEAVYSLGSLMAVKEPEKARAMLLRFLEQNPAQAPEAHFQLAKIEMELGHQKAAIKELKEAISLDPDNDSLAARYALAQAYEAESSTEAALAEYQKIRRIEPTNVSILDHIAQIYYEKGDWDAMREVLLDAKNAQNDDPTANHWLALNAERQGDWAKAAEYVEASAALKDEPGLTMRLSYYLSQAGRLDKAVQVLEGAHERWPNNDQVSYFLALGYDDQKRSRDAIALLRKVVALKPGYRDARYQLGVLYEKTGQMAQAEAEFRALLAEKADDASVLNYLGYSLAERGLQLDEAEAVIRRAVALEPSNAAYRDSLGWVHYKQGKSSEAVADLLKAANALPEDETVADHLGDAFAASGDTRAAWRCWKRSESLLGSDERLPGKAAKIEKEFDGEELGALYLDYLREVQDSFKKLGGLCQLRGNILGHEFSYPCMVAFRAPDELGIDILGPLFSPVFRMKLDAQGFTADTLRIDGLDSGAINEAAFRSVSLMRDYLSGRIFGPRPARYQKGWWSGRREVEMSGWRLLLDRASVRAETIVSLGEPDYRLSLRDFGRTEGRQVPRQLVVGGKGFELVLEFNNVNIEFLPR